MSYIIWSQARPRPFTLVQKISAFTPVKVSTCVFLIACLSLSAWTQWRLHAVDSSPSKTVYTCLKSPLLHPSKFIHGTSQCQRRPVTLGPMAAARGGIKPVQGRLHLSKISDFTPVQKSHSLHLWKISGVGSCKAPKCNIGEKFLLNIRFLLRRSSFSASHYNKNVSHKNLLYFLLNVGELIAPPK